MFLIGVNKGLCKIDAIAYNVKYVTGETEVEHYSMQMRARELLAFKQVHLLYHIEVSYRPLFGWKNNL